MLSNRHYQFLPKRANVIYLIQTQISCSVTETSSTQNNYRQESGEKC